VALLAENLITPLARSRRRRLLLLDGLAWRVVANKMFDREQLIAGSKT
jgi:hypothetical protein